VEGAEGHCSLCAQFEDGAVSHRVCMSGQKCSGKVRCVWQMQSTRDSRSMSTSNEKLNCRSHRSGRQREGTCYRN